MSLPWKQTAKRYKDCFDQAVEYLKELSEQELKIVVAAKLFKNATQKPANPFVHLFGGKDISVEKAKQNLFKVLEDYE